MKRAACIVLSAMVFLLSGCGKSADRAVVTENPAPPAHVEATAATAEAHQTVVSQVDFDDAFDLIDIPEAGLKQVEVLYKNEARFGTDIRADVYVLCDRRFDSVPFDTYLAVRIDGNMLLKDLDFEGDDSSPAYEIDAYLSDVDGDSYDEIILQQCIAMSGGAGGYRSRILKYQNGEITELFDSPFENQFDTGFRCEITENAEVRVYNILTGTSETFAFTGEKAAYMEWVRSVSGKENHIMVDSFCRFSPCDMDDDDVSEILCEQYVSLYGHVDGIGYAKSILKYDAKTGSFRVTEARMLASDRLTKTK